MKNLILFYLLSSPFIVLAQNNVVNNVTMQRPIGTAGDAAGFFVTVTPHDASFEGTTYLFTNWEANYQIFVAENKGYKVSNLNYNIQTNKLESKVSKDSMFQYDVDKITFIKQGINKYKFYKIDGSNELFQIINSSNDVTFLKGYKLDVVSGSLNPLTQEYTQNDKYVIKNKYYLKLNNKDFVQLDLKKRKVLKLMDDKADLVKKYASESKLSFTSEKDLCKIFQYYDSLL